MGATTANVAVVGPISYWGTGLYDLGVAILEETLRLAAHAYRTSTNPTAEEVRCAVAFLQGTALDITIETFRLGYSAERLRSGFFGQWMSHSSG